VGTLAAALVVGGVAGVALAVGPGLAVACGGADPTETRTRDGALAADGDVEVRFNCGRLDVTLADDEGWQLAAGGDEPQIESTDARLVLRTPDRVGFVSGRQHWDLSLPAEALSLQVNVNAASSRMDLADGQLERLNASLNAGEAQVDLAGTEIDDLRFNLNAGSLAIETDDTTRLTGRLEVNAGSIDLCVPRDATIEVRVDANVTFSHNLSNAGLTEVANDHWSRGDGSPAFDLRISGNAASFNLAEPGACSR
jgi:hypothetical protein